MSEETSFVPLQISAAFGQPAQRLNTSNGSSRASRPSNCSGLLPSRSSEMQSVRKSLAGLGQARQTQQKPLDFFLKRNHNGQISNLLYGKNTVFHPGSKVKGAKGTSGADTQSSSRVMSYQRHRADSLSLGEGLLQPVLASQESKGHRKGNVSLDSNTAQHILFERSNAGKDLLSKLESIRQSKQYSGVMAQRKASQNRSSDNVSVASRAASAQRILPDSSANIRQVGSECGIRSTTKQYVVHKPEQSFTGSVSGKACGTKSFDGQAADFSATQPLGNTGFEGDLTMDDKRPATSATECRGRAAAKSAMMSVQDMVHMQMYSRTNGLQIGIDGYRVPITCGGKSKAKSVANMNTKEKKTNFVDQEIKNRSWVPGHKYNVVKEWKERFPVNFGKFKRANRDTFTDEVMSHSRKYSFPSPGVYDGANKGLLLNPKANKAVDKEHKGLYHVDYAMYRAKQTPDAKYNPDYSLTRSSVIHSKIFKEGTHRTPKQGTPAVGEYKTETADRLVYERSPIQISMKEQRKCFVDMIAARTKKHPSMCTYQVTPKTYNSLSRSPISIRKVRH